MNLAHKMKALEASGRFAIWKRTSSPTAMRTIRKDIKSYLCEHTKKNVAPTRISAGTQANWLKDGIDYLTKEEQGKLKVFGFLREDVIKQTGEFPHRMDNDDLIDACLTAWEARLRKKRIKRVAHKYVLALNPELCEVISKTGHGVDELLTEAVRKTLRKYQEKYCPSETLGYLVGIHHDKAHLHAHVMLFPTSDSGKLLLVTDYSKNDRVNGHKRPFTDMRKFAEREVARFYEREIKKPFRATDRSPSHYAQPKLIAFLAYARSGENGVEFLPGESRRSFSLRERELILKQRPEQLRKTLRQAYDFAKSMHAYLCEAKARVPKDYENRKKQVLEERSLLNNELKELFQKKRSLKAEHQANYADRRRLYNDMANWRRLRFHGHSMAETGVDSTAPETLKWLESKMGTPNELGTLIREWLQQEESRKKAADLPREILSLMASAQNPVVARKFSEKDRYVRKCIAYGSERLRNPAIQMLEQYYRGNEMLSRTGCEDFVREFLKSSISVNQNELKILQDRRDNIEKRIREIRVMQQSNKLKQDIMASVENGRRPAFLEEYEHWNQIELEIPIHLPREDRDKAQLAHRVEQKEPFSHRIQASIQRVREARMDTGPFTVRRNFESNRALASDPLTSVSRTKQTVVDLTVNARARVYLQEHSRKPSLEASGSSIDERRMEVRSQRMGEIITAEVDR